MAAAAPLIARSRRTQAWSCDDHTLAGACKDDAVGVDVIGATLGLLDALPAAAAGKWSKIQTDLERTWVFSAVVWIALGLWQFHRFTRVEPPAKSEADGGTKRVGEG